MTDIRELMQEMLKDEPALPDITDRVFSDGHHLRRRRRVTRWIACVAAGTVVAAIAVPIAISHDHGTSRQLVTIGPLSTGGPPAPSPMPKTSPACQPTPGSRCTRYGELGPWEHATLSRDQRQLTVTFTSLCAGRGYRTGVRETAQRVTIAVYGPRPLSNLCEGLQTATVELSSPLAGRPVFDAYDGQHIPVQPSD